MPWNDAYEIPIVPSGAQAHENWVEQLLGAIVKPLVSEFQTGVRWLWVTRYVHFEPPPGITLVPSEFLYDGMHRYILFRCSVEESIRAALQARTIQHVTSIGGYSDPIGWSAYDVVGDLGSDRFVHERATAVERQQRAQRIVTYMDATLHLMLDALIEDDQGQWQLETNTSAQNPHGSLFESIHHLFCNTTNVPTTIGIAVAGTSIQLSTPWMQPINLRFDPGSEQRGELRLYY